MTATRPKPTELQLTALTWAAGGATAVYAAREMGISVTAFNGLLFEVRMKLCATNTTHAVALAYQAGYLVADQPAVAS